MCALGSKSYQNWKRVWLAAELFALFGCACTIADSLSYRYYSTHGISWASNHITVRIMGLLDPFICGPVIFSFLGTLLFLLIVSPFLMGSRLRPAAVKAWIIGALALLCFVFFVYYARS